jgi:hypothetical protein
MTTPPGPSGVRRAWRRAQHGWPERFPLVQFPNAPLLLALGASLVSALTEGDVHDHARAVFHVAFSAWGWDELARGTNWFRRLLGVAALVSVVLRIAGS